MEFTDHSAYGQPNYMEQVDFGTSEDELSCNETVYFEEFEGEPRISTPIIVDSDVEVPETPSTIQPDEENDVFIDLPSHAKKGGNLVAEVTGYVYSHKRSNIWSNKLLFEVWNAFIEGNISAGTMHGRCSRLVGCPSNL